MTDRDLLDQFVRTGSHEAFAALVQRHIGIVYNAARRQVRDPALADDICQAVFIVLARRAASLSPDVILPGWLIRTTHLSARDAQKAETRRRIHEQRYAAMSPTQTKSAETTDASAFELSPEIDGALSQLNDADRAVVVFRYLEGQSVEQVAAAFNVSIEAATKRLHRAMVRLRDHFSRHPITPSIAALSAAMEQFPHAAPPAAMVHATTAAALSGTATATSSLIAKGALKAIFWTPAKIFAASLAAALVGLTVVGTMSMVRAQTDAAPTSSPSTAPAGATATAIAHLSNGVSIEILGVNASPDNGKPWWSANGSALPAPPSMQGFMNGSMSSNLDVYQMIARINEKIAGNPEPATVNWSLADRPAVIGFPGWKSATDGRQRHFFPVANTAPATVRVNVATGEWKALLQSGPGGKSAKIGDETYTISAASDSGGRAVFTLTQPAETKDAQRVIVIDTAGKSHTPVGQGFGNNGKTQTGDYNARIPLRTLKEIRVETRPFDQWMEIRNVCLNPAHPTEIKIVTSDEPPQGL